MKQFVLGFQKGTVVVLILEALSHSVLCTSTDVAAFLTSNVKQKKEHGQLKGH